MLKNSLLKTREKPMMGFAGRYRLVVRNAKTHDVVRETDWFENLILDAGLNRIGNAPFGQQCIAFAAIGTGTTAPANGDTTLGAQSASTTVGAPGNGVVSNSGSPQYITTNTFAFRFNAGTLDGNYTEVGVGWSSPNLFSRALIVDIGGSPTSISVGITEYLDVFYQIRIVPDLATYTNTISISGTSYDVQRKPAGVSAISVQRFANSSITLFTAANLTGSNLTVYTGTMGAVTGTPSGTTASTSNATVLDAYANNSYERTGTITIGLNDCNVTGGIKSMVFGTNYICYQMEFSSKIPKDATKVMTLSGKATWGRL